MTRLRSTSTASKSKPIRKQTKSALKRQQILDAAAKMFRERGYANATLNEIAAVAGTQAGSLYYYFTSREELVEKVLEISMQKTAQHVAGAVAALRSDVPQLLRVETAIRAHIASILTLDDYLIAYQKIINQVPDDIKQHFIFFPRAYATFWKELIDAAQKSGELRADLSPTLMRLLLLGSISWALEWYKPDGPNSPTDIADHVVSIFFHGMLPQAATGAPPVRTAAKSHSRKRKRSASIR